MKLTKLLLAVTLLIGFIGCKNTSQQNSTEKQTVKIGAIIPLSGDFASYGQTIKNGYELGLKELNAKDNNFNVNVQYEDSKSDVKESVNAIQKLISIDNVNLILGPFSSSDVLSCGPIAEKNKRILFTTSASSPAISDLGDYVFRNVPSDNLEATLMANFLTDNLKINKISIIHINSEYGLGVLNAFKKVYSDKGLNIENIVSYNPETKDFKTILLKIKAEKPEAIYLVGYKELGIITKQLSEMGINSKLFSTALFEDKDVLTSAGNSANGVVFTSITFDPNSTDPRAIAFSKSYSENYGSQPDGFAAVAYDGIYILYPILKKCGNNAECIKEELYKVQNFPGLLGNVSIDNKGDVSLPIKLKKVQDGKFVDYNQE